MTTVRCYHDEALVRLLAGHPEVRLLDERAPDHRVLVDQDGWSRELRVGDADVEVSGLIELMDNNPLVCADVASVPGPASTLALIAFGPLVRAGLMLEAPVMQVGGVVRDDGVDAFLSRFEWSEGAVVSFGEESFGGCVAAVAVAVVATPDDWGSIDELYRESFAHSFYVRELSTQAWDTSLVAGTPFAGYRLAYTPGDETSLLTVQVMADGDGKCGAAQTVHALNVMCGFEECLGVPESGL